MTTRLVLFVAAVVWFGACDGALSVGGPADPVIIDTTGETDEVGEVGEAEVAVSWDGALTVLASPWSSCKERGRWAKSCVDGDGCCPSYCSPANDDDCGPVVPEPPPEPDPVCGDGTVDPGEVCDGDCPTTCDAPDACTTAALVGSADTCDAVCELVDVTACVGGDGCCPSACSYETDTDCPMVAPPEPSCGDGNVDPGELCDGNCPTTCSSPDACTTATLAGAASTCDAVCEYEAVSQCVGGDGCCPTGCIYDNDTDCPMPPPPNPPALDCTNPSSWPQQWIDYEDQVLTLVNQRRASGANCGSAGTFGPAGAVSMNPQMRQASRCHSLDMDLNSYFSHTSQDGRNFVTRLRDAGYTGSPRGENIAAGYSTPDAVMTGWMNSDGHCANIMNAGVNRMGIGYTNETRATWTMTTGNGD